MNLENIKSIHFVGIGGIGMSGLAGILADEGFLVSGCDLKRSSATDMLTRRGIQVETGHDSGHLDAIDLVVVTSAVRGANAEVDAARDRGTTVVKRSQLLGALVNRRRSIGVSGTHGKTTTSAMIATVLAEAGLDPTVIVGGMLRNLGTNAKSGAGEFLVVEADEYDRTFHQLHPEIAVVTNIEADHLEYYGTFEAIEEAFRIFLEGVRPGGALVVCHDDPACAAAVSVQAASEHRVIRYGLSEGADLRAVNLEFDERGSSFEVAGVGRFRMFVPGEHNVRNALAAIAVGRELGIEPQHLATGLARFLGVDRRFQILGDFNGAIIVDDYAHHPTEIRATLSGARSGYPSRRIVALFQPHLFSRTREFATDFAAALAGADVALVAPVYAAREAPVEGVTSALIADAGAKIEFLQLDKDGLIAALRTRLQPGDLFVAMGAGDVHEIAEALVEVEQ